MARSPSPHTGESTLRLPGAANSFSSQAGPYQVHQSTDGASSSDLQLRWRPHDPRSSSTQSLLPSLAEDEDRRILLIIYIHGFMGNDMSFRSFPAHIHSYLKEALVESHAVHTKIYPRYKTYKSIEVARDNFSKWLEPHESPRTDIILIGHSMGGLLAADVALQVRVSEGTLFPRHILTVHVISPVSTLRTDTHSETGY